MCKLKALILVGIIPFLACTQDEESPDLAEIGGDYCAIVQKCDSDPLWESQEACEAHSAEEFEKTRTEDKACYDARLIMETCLGAFASCEEYAKFEQEKSYECQMEFSDFYGACRLP